MSRILDIPGFPLRQARLIEASAGTGKTYTITGLYLRLLLGRNGPEDFGLPLTVDKILVVTFTEAATAELRGRILARIRAARKAFDSGEAQGDELIAALLAGSPDRAQEARRLRVAERQMDEAAIFTIHGFCQRMLRHNAFESGALFETELVGDDQRLRFEAVADFWRQQLYGASRAQVAAVRECWASPQDLLAELNPQLATQALHCKVSGRDWRLALAEGLARIDAFKAQWRAAAADLPDVLAASGLDKRSYSARNLPNWLTQVGQWALTDTQDLSLPDNLYRFGQALLCEKSPKGAPPAHPLFAEVDALLADRPDIRGPWLAQALDEVRRRMAQAKTQRQQRSFDDLLTGLDVALAGPAGEGLAARIREQYPVAMIDEFQDTDPLQYRLFATLYRGRPECGLYLIGDPKQAIYGFRGADIFTYMQARAEVSDHYTLETNFRSTTELVAAVNGLFAQAASPFIYDQAIPFTPVRAKGKSDTLSLDGAPLPPLPYVLASEPLAGGAYRQQMARAAAAQIHAWLLAAQQGRLKLGDRPLVPGDIAVLVRTGGEAAELRRCLDALSIGSVYLSSRESVFATAEAEDLRRLLNACLHPADEDCLRSALASRLLGWSMGQLAALNEDEALWEETVALFRQWGKLWQRQGVLPMLRQLLFHYRIPAQLLQAPDGERRLTDLLHLGELLQQAAATLAGEHALLRWFQAQCLAPDGNAEEQQLRLESERHLVQVVTIHKSKGLQYPLVLLPFISAWRVTSQANYHEQGQSVWDLQADAAALEQAEQERLAEDLRLLYVALTRGVYLTWLGLAEVKVKPAGAGNAFMHLLPAGESLAERLAATQVSGLVPWDPLPWPAAGQLSRSAVTPHWQARQFARRLDRHWQVTSYSALVANTPHVGLPAPAPEAPRLDALGFPRGARAGTFLHNLLEGLDFGLPAGEALQGWIDERLTGVRLTADWQAEPWRPVLHDWLLAVLEAPLQPGLRLRDLPSQRTLAELEFLLPLARIQAPVLSQLLAQHDSLSARAPALNFDDIQGMLKGFIDLVFEHEGRFYVVDYKSNYLGERPEDYQGEALAQAMLAHRYDLQYQIYSLALHRYLSTRLADYDYELHMGGVCYLFLRGMPAGQGAGVYFTRPSLEFIQALDRLFAGADHD